MLLEGQTSNRRERRVELIRDSISWSKCLAVLARKHVTEPRRVEHKCYTQAGTICRLTVWRAPDIAIIEVACSLCHGQLTRKRQTMTCLPTNPAAMALSVFCAAAQSMTLIVAECAYYGLACNFRTRGYRYLSRSVFLYPLRIQRLVVCLASSLPTCAACPVPKLSGLWPHWSPLVDQSLSSQHDPISSKVISSHEASLCLLHFRSSSTALAARVYHCRDSPFR